MKKFLTAAGLSAVLVFGGAASCEGSGEPTEFEQYEFPDCDADDKVGKWDVADCGPSPAPRTSVRPMQTAFQPKPGTKTNTKPGTAPKPPTKRK